MKYLGSIIFILLVLIILPFPGLKGPDETYPDIKLLATISFVINALGCGYLSSKNLAMPLSLFLIHLLLTSPLILLIIMGQQGLFTSIELITMLSFILGQLVFILAFIKRNQI